MTEIDTKTRRTIRSLNESAYRAISSGLTDHALKLSHQAMELACKSFGPDSADYAAQLQLSARHMAAADDPDGAERCLEEALALRKVALGADHPAVASILFDLAHLQLAAGQCRDALEILERCREIRFTRLGAEHPLTRRVESAIEGCLDAMGADSADMEAARLHNDGIDLIGVGRFEEAESALISAIERNRASMGPAHKHVALCLRTLGDLYVEIGAFARAKPVLEEAHDICRGAGDGIGELYGMVLGTLARACAGTGEFERARQLHEGAIHALESLQAPPADVLSTALGNFSAFEHDQGHRDEAASLNHRALALIEPLAGRKWDAARAKLLNGLAILAQDEGDMTGAIRYMEASVELKARTLGNGHPSYALGADNLASMYGMIGDDDRSKQWNEAAKRALEDAGMTSHRSYIKALATSASIAKEEGDLATARLMLERAIQIAEETGSEGETVARVRSQMASLEARGAGGSSLQALETIMRHELRAVGPGHPRYARTLAAYATARISRSPGQIDAEAVSMLAEAINVLERSEAPAEVLPRIYILIDCLWAEARLIDIARELPRLMRLEDRVLAERTFLEGKLSSTFGDWVTETLSMCASIHLLLGESKLPLKDVLDCSLARKGRILESIVRDRTRMLEQDYPSIRSALDEIANATWLIAEAAFEGPVRHLERLEATVREATKTAERLREEVVSSLTREDAEIPKLEASYAAIASRLEPGQALLDIVRYRRRDMVRLGNESDAYLAFVSVGGQVGTRLVELGPAGELDTAVNSALSAIASRSLSRLTEPTEISDALRPLAETIREILDFEEHSCTTLFVAPDGELWRFPFDLLTASGGQHLIDIQQVIYLTSPMDLVASRARARKPGPAFVVSDPDFDLAGKSQEETPWYDAPEDQPSNPGAGIQIIYSKVPDDAPDLGFERLIGSMTEGKSVASSLGATHLTRTHATKNDVRAIHRPRALHFATHGFSLDSLSDLHQLWSDRLRAGRVFDVGASMEFMRFTTALVADEVGNMMPADEGDPERAGTSWPFLTRACRDPLIRSGLVLAGANSWLSRCPTNRGAGNGILTALEIAHMDLSTTELVVLSGCNTGTGAATTARGVEGLRRGFLLAGARCMVVTLWEIPDQETQELIGHFYHRVTSGERGAAALRGAKLWMKARHPDPYFWAGFVIYGDCGPLDGETDEC